MIQTIDKGKHYCHPKKWGVSFKQKHEWIVRVDDSICYDMKDKEAQFAINKLCGVFFPLGGITKINGTWNWSYSARHGFRWWEEQVQVMAYVHNKQAVSKATQIGVIERNRDCYFSLDSSSRVYEFGVEHNTAIVPKNHHYRLCCPENFYFGGEKPSVREMRLNIREL